MAGAIQESQVGEFTAGLALDSGGADFLVSAVLLGSLDCWRPWALLAFAIVEALLPPGIVFVLALLVAEFGLRFAGLPHVLPGAAFPACLLGFGGCLPIVLRFPGS